MTNYFTYNVATNFSRYPGGRKRSSGNLSGEEFYETVTVPLLNEHEFVHFDLSGSAGMSTGFLDEAFGEIGRLLGLKEARRRVKITCEDDDDAVDESWERIEAAAKAHRP